MKLVLLLGLLLAQAVCAQERVVDFHSTIRIDAEGGIAVTERIAVQAEGKDIRRGILRDFPTDYRDRLGNSYRVPFHVLHVTRDGAPENFALERLANGTRVRIGRGDTLLPNGVHTYEIEYRTGRQIGFFPDHDELYWNVNGNGWTFPFDHVSAEVHLPKAVPAAELRGEAYTGRQGARGRSYQQMFRDGAVGFTSTARFAPYEGMTIVVGFPKGVVTEPGWMKRAEWFLSDNRGIGAGVAGLALTLAFLWWRWLLVGRDPRAAPAFPRYEAPKGLSPAAVRFIDRQGYDACCFAAALLGMGSRGLIRIRQIGNDYRVDPAKAPPFQPTDFLPGDRAAWTAVQSGRTITRTYDETIHIARTDLERELRLLYEEKVFSRNRGSLVAGVVLGALTMLAMLFLDATPRAVIAFGIALMAIFIAFYKWLPAYSVAGRRLEDEIVGLKQYLGVAEKDDLARAKAPPKTPEEFSRFLPYAVALGVEATWADRFARALGAAAVTQAVSSWYSSGDGSSSSSFSSISNLTSSFNSMGGSIASSGTPPGSSSGSSGGDSGGGGGGGGSSGGGGGGGGGSGW